MKLEIGKKFYCVRNREGIDPLPSDWRENPSDVVHASYLGKSEDGEHLFDDGRVVRQMVFLTFEDEDLERFVHQGQDGDGKLAAQAVAKEEGEALALWYAREDAEGARLFLACVDASPKEIGEKCEGASKEARTIVGRVLLGIVGKVSATEIVVALKDAHKKGEAGKMTAKAKETLSRVTKRHGDAVKLTNREAGEAEEKAEKERAKADKAKAKEAAKKETEAKEAAKVAERAKAKAEKKSAKAKESKPKAQKVAPAAKAA